LATDLKYNQVLNQMRQLTKVYDQQMAPCANEYEPIVPNSTALLEWVKNEKPALYQQMRDGIEIGFQSLSKEYDRMQNRKNNK